MPIVLKAVALGPPRAKRQHRVEAIERLNRGLLIDTEHRGVLRWIDVQPDHVGGLALEVRIIGGHVALQPMGLKPGAPPDPRDHHVIYLWLLKIPKSEKTIRVLGDGAVGSPPAACSNGNRTALTADQL